MGTINKKLNNPVESRRKQQRQQSILDSQELSVNNTEQNINLQELISNLNNKLEVKEQQILDLQEIIIEISETGGIS